MERNPRRQSSMNLMKNEILICMQIQWNCKINYEISCLYKIQSILRHKCHSFRYLLKTSYSLMQFQRSKIHAQKIWKSCKSWIHLCRKTLYKNVLSVCPSLGRIDQLFPLLSLNIRPISGVKWKVINVKKVKFENWPLHYVYDLYLT